jgi:hypothetical protein
MKKTYKLLHKLISFQGTRIQPRKLTEKNLNYETNIYS